MNRASSHLMSSQQCLCFLFSLPQFACCGSRVHCHRVTWLINVTIPKRCQVPGALEPNDLQDAWNEAWKTTWLKQSWLAILSTYKLPLCIPMNTNQRGDACKLHCVIPWETNTWNVAIKMKQNECTVWIVLWTWLVSTEDLQWPHATTPVALKTETFNSLGVKHSGPRAHHTNNHGLINTESLVQQIALACVSKSNWTAWN